MENLTSNPTRDRRARIGNALIVLGTIGLFGFLFLEQPLGMLAGLILFVVGLSLARHELRRSIARQHAEARSKAAAHAASPVQRPSVARLVLAIGSGVVCFMIARAIVA